MLQEVERRKGGNQAKEGQREGSGNIIEGKVSFSVRECDSTGGKV